MTRRVTRTLKAVLAAMGVMVGTVPGVAWAASYSVGPISDVSSLCSNQNAESEQAVDTKLGYVYEVWMGAAVLALPVRQMAGLASLGR